MLLARHQSRSERRPLPSRPQRRELEHVELDSRRARELERKRMRRRTRRFLVDRPLRPVGQQRSLHGTRRSLRRRRSSGIAVTALSRRADLHTKVRIVRIVRLQERKLGIQALLLTDLGLKRHAIARDKLRRLVNHRAQIRRRVHDPTRRKDLIMHLRRPHHMQAVVTGALLRRWRRRPL